MAAAMGATADDKATAKQHAILTAGLGILANAYKPAARHRTQDVLAKLADCYLPPAALRRLGERVHDHKHIREGEV